jgi:hypothetical protein
MMVIIMVQSATKSIGKYNELPFFCVLYIFFLRQSFYTTKCHPSVTMNEKLKPRPITAEFPTAVNFPRNYSY